MLDNLRFDGRVTHQSVWDQPTPRLVNLILKLLPAFTEAEAGCPVIHIKPLLADLNHAPTLAQVMQRLQADRPEHFWPPAISLGPAGAARPA